MTFEIITAFIIYFLILIFIAIAVYHKNKNVKDYTLGGRSMNYFTTAIAAQASDMSSWLFLAFPAAVYLNGIFEYWTAIGLIVFMYINWTFIAPKIRVATQEYNSLTLSSYLSARCHDTKGYISFLSAFFSVFFFTVYIAAGLAGMGLLFHGSFGLPFYTSVFISVIIALLYTLIGGFLAVAWCNVFKGLFMLAVILLVPLYIYWQLPGIHFIINSLHQHNISLSLFPADKSVLHSLFLVGGWGLGYFGQPHILIYFMGIDDVKKINYAKYIGMIWMTIALLAAGGIGLLSTAYFSEQIKVPEMLFINLVKDIFNPFFAGIALCGVFAATLATMNNHILIAGSVIAEDWYKKFLNAHASSNQLIWVSRLGSFCTAAFAMMVLFVGNSKSIYQLVGYAWSGLGSSFGPVLIWSLYRKHISQRTAFVGILVGGLTSCLFPLFNTSIMPLIPGFGFSLISVILISFLEGDK